MNELITPAEADARISSSLTTLPAETVPLARAVGRRLLAGELAIRVADVKEAQPLEFIQP